MMILLFVFLLTEHFLISDDELCYDSNSSPLCPSSFDYEELLYCCVKDGAAFCCNETEKTSHLVGVE